MSRRIASLAVALLLGIGPWLGAQTELRQARQMIQQRLQQGREEAEASQKEGAQPEFSWQEYNRWLLQVRGLINRGLVSALNRRPRPSTGELQNQLRDVVIIEADAETNASVFSLQTDTGKLYVAAYALGVFATNSRSWVGVFGSEGEAKPYRLLASVDNSLPDKTIAVQPLNHPGDQGFTFLAYGINWGDAHNRLTVIAYSFDGKKLEPVWSKRDLPQGQISVEGTRISLAFLSSALGPGYDVQEITEIYRVTSSGIRLERRSERPRD